MAQQKIIVIGSGFAGLSAACFLAKAGQTVTVVEKHDMPGGRARQFTAEGFSFDMGPSWYWMPDVFERFFACFDKKVSDYYTLIRLDPSYRVYWPEGGQDIPADYAQLQQLFESLEPGSAKNLDKFMEEAAYKYRVGMQKLVFKPGQSFLEFLDAAVLRGLFRLDVFSSIKQHVRKYFSHPQLRQLLEFPVLFLGALPENTPALYSLMNYADIKLGTWYPQGGMYRVVAGIYQLALSLGVQFRFNEEVRELDIQNGQVRLVRTGQAAYEADVVVGGADYHFIETHLLEKRHRSYSENYWNKRVMAPSCLIYYVGLNRKLKNVMHHSLFFDVPFDQHAREIYVDPRWPQDPLFYMSCTSQTDPAAAPAGCENLFILIPVATGLQDDNETLREKYFDRVIQRIEKHVGESIREGVIYKKSYAHSDFVRDYHAFRGNAYGLANTLLQTAVLKPSLRSKKVKNLFYTGQLTVPGPGVPPSIISGEVVARQVLCSI